MGFEWVRAIHDAFNIESPRAFAALIGLLSASIFGFSGAAIGYVVDKAYRKAEERRLLEISPEYAARYSIERGSTFRLDTLDQDLRKIGLRFDGMSPPQAKPTPDNDSIRAEYFQLASGLYLRTQWRGGQIMPPEVRALAERVILAHEARLK